jgi:site-specific DNA-methyltransferase (adenine-specific)
MEKHYPDKDGILYQGDSRRLSAVGDETVHLVVTSPPYGTMKFGYGLSEYADMLRGVVFECVRVLKPDGKLCINVNNYVTSKKEAGSRYIVPITRSVQEWLDGTLIYMDEIFWFKNLPVHGKRPKPLFGSYPYPANFLMSQRVEYVLVYRKPGNRPAVSREIKEKSRLAVEEWRDWTQNLWQIQTVQANDRHPAMFPPELPRRLIRLYSFVADTVLDPFVGSGTTAVAARDLERRYIGVDTEKEFLDLAVSRLRNGGGRESS